jgi:tetratricopeptide (TPR) repeat protein
MFAQSQFDSRRRTPSRSRLTPVITIALMSGCVALPETARNEIVQADRDYAAGDYRSARGRLDRVIDDYPRRAETAEAYYIRGLCHARLERRSDAVVDMTRCIELSRRNDLSARARTTLGGIAFDLGRYDEAKRHFAQAVDELPPEPPADEAYYEYGVALQREGDWEEAAIQFSRLLHHFPSSRHADDARRRFNWRNPFFSIQCGVFGEDSSADELVRNLANHRLTARVEKEARGGRTFSVVYLGRYRTHALAQSALATVRRHISDALVVP